MPPDHGTTRTPHPSAEEREVKLAVDEDFTLPALTTVEGVTVRDHGESHLHAVYWDTGDLRLAGAGVGLRHRNGTWTFKGTSVREGDAVVRDELEVVGSPQTIPDAVSSHLSRWAEAADLQPVAELDTTRHTLDALSGDMEAEVVHDRVRVIDNNREVVRFAEVEVEFEQRSTPLAERLVRLLRDHGAVVDATPKLVRALRALGHEPPRRDP